MAGVPWCLLSLRRENLESAENWASLREIWSRINVMSLVIIILLIFFSLQIYSLYDRSLLAYPLYYF